MSSGEPAGGALALADEAYALVQVNPRLALSAAERALAASRSRGDGRAEVVALHALAWAQFQLGDARAPATVRAGIRTAERHGDRRGVGLLRRRLAFSYAMAGRTRAAQREIGVAIALLDGPDRARSEVFRLEIHRRSHTVDPATHRVVLAHASRALHEFRRNADEIWEARLLRNRGLLLTDRGELDAAELDLRRAHTLYKRLGAEAAALDTIGSIAELARLRGDVVGCLQLLDDANATQPSAQLSVSLQDYRAAALAEARMLPEARAAAEAYVELCSRVGSEDEVPRSMLSLAAIALMAQDPASARRLATRAASYYRARRKPVHGALAQAVRLRAELLEGNVGRSSLRTGIKAAVVLETAGWRRDALRTRLLVARLALVVGSHATARRELTRAQPLRRCGTVADRIELCHTRALLRLADGDSTGAERLLVEGLRLLDDHRAILGAVELRATASGIGIELSRRGLEIAIESRRPAKVLSWAERLRGNALRLDPVRPPGDRELSALQTRLRQVAGEIRDAEEKRKPAPGRARQAQLEAAIRARTRLLPGEGGAHGGTPDPRVAAKVLEDRALVEYVTLNGALGALTLVDGRLRFHELGCDSSGAELEWLRFALGRLARGRGELDQRAAASSSARAAAASLDRLLVEPLLRTLGDAKLVLVPTGALHALPWATLPSLRGRALVVAPSLYVWLDLAQLPRSKRRKTAVIAGPRLRHSAAEARDVAALLPSSVVLHGKAATAKATLAALDGAALAHIACHGRFRSDSPLFSSLELADGPLNVYQLQGLRRAPEVVVLSACDLAVSRLHPGDELLGLASALLGMGTRTIVASVVPVPDAAARRLMLAFHTNLATGLSPASALARAQSRSAVAGFVCLGSG